MFSLRNWAKMRDGILTTEIVGDPMLNLSLLVNDGSRCIFIAKFASSMTGLRSLEVRTSMSDPSGVIEILN